MVGKISQSVISIINTVHTGLCCIQTLNIYMYINYTGLHKLCFISVRLICQRHSDKIYNQPLTLKVNGAKLKQVKIFPEYRCMGSVLILSFSILSHINL